MAIFYFEWGLTGRMKKVEGRGEIRLPSATGFGGLNGNGKVKVMISYSEEPWLITIILKLLV